jgi:hypothetical protein
MNHHTRSLFLHIPKTSDTSIEHCLLAEAVDKSAGQVCLSLKVQNSVCPSDLDPENPDPWLPSIALSRGKLLRPQPTD